MTDVPYSYSNGVFYEPAGQSYKIVQPPLGVFVTSIPEGAATVTVNGANYREFGGVWYRPFYSGSDRELIFEVTQEANGGYWAECLTETIVTEGDTWEELRRNVREGGKAFYFDQ